MQIIYPKNNKPYFYDGRRIIKIRTPLFEQAFYQSSGLNTRVGGTWFPFDGIDSHNQLNKSFVVTIAKFKFGIKNCRELANNRELSWEGNPMEKINEIFCRLGNCYYALISQALGGPLWQGEIGKLFNPVFKQKCGELRPQLGITRGYKVNDGKIDSWPSQINKFVGTAVTINFRDNLKGTTFERFFNSWDKKHGIKKPLDITNFLDSKGMMKGGLLSNAMSAARGYSYSDRLEKLEKRETVKKKSKVQDKVQDKVRDKQKEKRKKQISARRRSPQLATQEKVSFNMNRKSKRKSRKRSQRRTIKKVGNQFNSPTPKNRKLYNLVVRDAKKKYNVWPSAYASGWVVKEYKKRGGKYSGKKREQKGLQRWFKEKWINVCKLPKKISCGRPRSNLHDWQKNYPYCRPSKKITKNTPKIATKLTYSQIQYRCKKKRANPRKRIIPSS